MNERAEALAIDHDDVVRMMQVFSYRLARVEGFLGIGTPTKPWVMKMLTTEPRAGKELHDALKSIWPSPPPLEVIETWGYAQRMYVTEYAAVMEARRVMPEIPLPKCPDWLEPLIPK